MSEPIRLTFYLTLGDGVLLNYSDIPPEVGKPYYLKNINGEGNHRLNLHSSELMSEADRLSEVLSQSSLHGWSDDEVTNLQLKNAQEEVIFDGTWEEFTQQYDDYDLRELGYAGIEINQDGNLVPSYFSIPDLPRPFAIADFFIGPEATDYSFDKVKGANYKLSMGARSVFWKYNLVNRGSNSYTDFKMLLGKEIVPTTEATKVTLLDGSDAYQIESLEPIALKERYEEHMELEMVKNGTTTINQRIKRRVSLPAPDVQRIKMSKTDGEYKAYSEMYIYF